ncbi:MAG: hypothetical protein J6X44_03695, partial [Thermoguttaceae bacterium]|nr:hypothetical protein [Thermoguttaceae bacterium]
MPSFDWILFYQELADKLLPFKNDRKSLVKKLKNVYAKLGIDFPEIINHDVDPFTVYGFFNKSRMGDAKRISIARGIKEELCLEANVPQSFDGVPLLMPLQAAFTWFNDNRGIDVCDRFWKVFEVACSYADLPNEKNKDAFIKAYNTVKDLKGLKWRLSIALYWTRPYSYLNLDSRNRDFLSLSAKIDPKSREFVKNMKKAPDGNGYLDICQAVSNSLKTGDSDFHDFPNLSYQAWIGSNTAIETLPVQTESRRFWIYAPGCNADHWDEFYKLGIMGIGWEEIGDLSQYSNQKEIQEAMRETYDSNQSFTQAAHITWQFANEMKEGDVVYVKKGVYGLVGRGVITDNSEYFYDSARKDFNHIREVRWTHNVKWKLSERAPNKTLTDITPYAYFVDPIKERFGDGPVEHTFEPYASDDFLNEVYMCPEDYQRLTDVLKVKKNIVLQGAPGVGKTFTAKRLAYSIMGEKDEER